MSLLRSNKKLFVILLFICISLFILGSKSFSGQRNPMMHGLSEESLLSSKTRAADSLNCTLVGGWFTGPGYAVCVVDTLAYIGAGQSMKILNVKDSTNPVFVGEVILPFVIIFDIFVRDTLAYVANREDGLRVINVSDPSTPFEVGFYHPLDCWMLEVGIQNNLAYVADGGRGLSIINISDPTSMNEVGYCSTYGNATSVWVQDTIAYLNNGWVGDLVIINVADSSSPSWIGSFSTGSSQDIWVQDTIAYVSAGNMFAVNVANPSSPTEISFYNVGGGYYIRKIWIEDTLAYLALSSDNWYADSCRLEIVNIADPDSISRVGVCLTSGSDRCHDVQVGGNFAYVAYAGGNSSYPCGLRIINVSDPSDPFETGRYEVGGINYKMFIKDSFAYVANSLRGLGILNIADPASVDEMSFYDTPGRAYDVYVKDTLAYVADEDSGLCIINVADPSSPAEIGLFDTPGRAIGIWIQDTFAYVADGGQGLRIINIADPSSPAEIGFYSDVPCDAWSVWVQDTLAYVADADTGFRIINVADPSTPSQVSLMYSSISDIYIEDTLAYLVGSRLYIVNMSDPTSPSEIGSRGLLGSTYDYKGVFVQEGLAYVGDADSELCIIDLSDPTNPTEAGFYRIYWELPAHDIYVRDSLIYAAYDVCGLYIFKYTGPTCGIEEIPIVEEKFNITSISNKLEINYSIVNNQEKVKIEIFNVLGQKMGTPVDGIQTRGNYTVNWTGKTGIYFVRMEIGEKVFRGKVLLLK